jgi:hypothetical protein
MQLAFMRTLPNQRPGRNVQPRKTQHLSIAENRQLKQMTGPLPVGAFKYVPAQAVTVSGNWQFTNCPF